MNPQSSLPSDIWVMIFEYDATYREVHATVMKDLLTQQRCYTEDVYEQGYFTPMYPYIVWRKIRKDYTPRIISQRFCQKLAPNKVNEEKWRYWENDVLTYGREGEPHGAYHGTNDLKENHLCFGSHYV